MIRQQTTGATTSAQGFAAYHGFRYSFDGGTTWIDARSSNSLPTTTSNSYTDIITLPRGTTQTITFEYCDTVLTHTFSIPSAIKLESTLATDLRACLNRGRIRIRKRNANGLVMGIRVLSTPPGQPAIPYFETSLSPADYLDPIELSNLMPGTYQIELLDTIGVLCPMRRTLSVVVNPFDFDFNFVVNCNKNLEITSNIALGTSINHFRVKIYDHLGNQVLGGVAGLAGSSLTYLNIPNTDLASLPDGVYTIRLGRRYADATDVCSYIEKTWIKNANNNLNLNNSVFSSGCANGLGAIAAAGSGGTPSYTFQLEDANDIIMNPTVPGGNLYNNLITSETYKLSVSDACGAIVNRLISSSSIAEIGTPGFANMPCVGDNISLTLPNFPGVTYQWYRDAVAIPAATGHSLDLTNLQPSDSALYSSVMTIGNCDIPGALLIDPKSCGGPLAVELISFNADCHSDGSVSLHWETASESNAMDFVLQKTNDLINWETLSIVAANGNSNVTSAYSVTDREPFDGTSYYQLIQRDFDGAENKYFPISNNCDIETELKVYPNPTNGNFKIKYYTKNKTTLTLQIIDMNGRMIRSEIHPLDKGTNTLFISEDLAKGMYLIHINTDNKENNPIKLVVN